PRKPTPEILVEKRECFGCLELVAGQGVQVAQDLRTVPAQRLSRCRLEVARLAEPLDATFESFVLERRIRRHGTRLHHCRGPRSKRGAHPQPAPPWTAAKMAQNGANRGRFGIRRGPRPR